jgi:lipopolysaccharide/colanic/teichoic acid biosynthesis glycosyltransferase
MINRKNKLILLLLLTGIFLLEPEVRGIFSFAVTPVVNPRLSDDTQAVNPVIAEPAIPHPQHQRTHAPEPGTLILLLSGLCGMIVRFAQRSFKQFKRLMDILLSCLGLTITLPLLGFCAALIKITSKGPVIYRQVRVGQNGELFSIYKLRSMCIDAEKDTGAMWARINDPRVTPIGKFLRKSHIDEIPQLINVIKGDMSIVGPRPERPEMVRDLKVLIRDYEKRLQVKPGITGLAQIYHKYDESITDVRKKIKYDLLYIKKMCWLLEIKTIAQTFIVAVTGKGAH